MRRKRSMIIALTVLAVGAAAAGAAILRQTRQLDEPITSIALKGTVHARVVLPAGYATSRKRYPVVYFLHGLPANADAYLGNDWLLDAVAAAGPAILVIPQGARDSDTDPEYLNWGLGRNWETYVASELPRYVDRHFRTIATRKGRALVGVSAGGYGATILGLHHLATFGAIESWSGYFHPTDPTGRVPLQRGANVVAHAFVKKLAQDERRRPTFLGFYVGRSDDRFYAENVAFNQELNAAHVDHAFSVYTGGHQTSLWERQATRWLRMALHHLAHAA